MATFYGNKGQYTDKQIRDFIDTYYNTEQGQKDIQYLVNQGAILGSPDPTGRLSLNDALTQRAAYYGLTQLLEMPQSEATAAMAAVFPSGDKSEVDALAKVYEKSMLGGVSQDELDRAAGAVGLYETDPFSIERVLESRGYQFGAPGSGELEKGYPSAPAIVEAGQRIADAGVGNMIFTPEYNPPGSDTNRYDLAKAIVEAPDAAAKAKAIELANAQQAAMNAAAQAEAQAKADKVMSDRDQAMALGLPPSTDMSGLSALSRYDFSKAAPQLRMAGMYAEPLVMPTTRPGLSSFQQTIGSSKGAVRQALQNRLPNQEITDADVNYWATHGGVNAVNQAFPAVGTPGTMPSYTMGRAPTREEAFMRYAFPDGVAGATDIEDNITRGLQFARNLGLNPTETLGLINRALPAGQSITPNQLQAAVEPRAGLLALAQPRVGPSVSFQREFGKLSDIPTKDVGANVGPPPAGGGAGNAFGIDVVGKSPFQDNDWARSDQVGSVEERAVGGPIRYDKGGDVAYTLADFGISTPSVTGTLGVPRNVVFNKALEAAEKGKVRTGLSDLIDLQNLAIRQGRTDRDYIDLLSRVADSYGYSPSQFGRIKARGPATSDVRTYNPYYFAEGGDVGRGLGSIAMKGYAQEMAQKGRFGDTMLAHISPEEAQMLQAAGGAGTINPETGLPEYFSWRKLFRKIAPIAQIALPFFGLPPITTAALSGIAGGLAGPGKGFDFKRGLMSGLMSYGMSSLAQGAGAASGASGDIPITPSVSNIDPTALEGMSREAVTSNLAQQTAAQQATQSANAALPKFGNVFESDKGFLSQLGENIQAVGRGGMEAAMGDKAAQEAFTAGQGSLLGKTMSPTVAAGLTVGGYSGMKATDEMTKHQLQQKIANAKTEEERKMWEQIAAQSLGYLPPTFAAAGGMMGALAAGGATGSANEPRTINGAGDGMSDSVPATIEGIQEARLADGEFVIPADVVADLGNGSSNAGSKKLYAMMDRVRKARHGTTRQPPEISMGRLMPA